MAVNGEKIPIVLQLDEKTLIDGAVVKPVTFSGFTEYLAEASALTAPRTIDAKLRRVRLAKQVTYYANGTVAPISMTDVLKLSIPSARKLSARLDDSQGVAGKLVRDGDGIDKSIVYELGTPIQVQGKAPIKELEFQAKLYGDIEDVMSAPTPMQQTQLLISMIAKPLGTSLMLLPSWAVDQITVADGVTIMTEVLPRFLGSPTEL